MDSVTEKQYLSEKLIFSIVALTGVNLSKILGGQTKILGGQGGKK